MPPRYLALPARDADALAPLERNFARHEGVSRKDLLNATFVQKKDITATETSPVMPPRYLALPVRDADALAPLKRKFAGHEGVRTQLDRQLTCEGVKMSSNKTKHILLKMLYFQLKRLLDLGLIRAGIDYRTIS